MNTNSLLIEEKVFKDPVHKYIYVQDRPIWDLVNTKEFQRLRRIRQLGTSFLTFHGAEHSRFSHSLGVYELTRKIISQFERNGYTDWPQEERLLCLCAALLHDLGHGPFSHSIEKTFDMHHEDWTCRFVLGDTEVNRVLREIDSSFPQKVAGIICKSYDKEIVVSLVSSQLDADRMDYLLRDGYYTGVNYGTFDLERVLRVMRPYKGHIVVKESGMHAVEDYLMSRYQMYWQIYFHPVTRSAEILLHNIFGRAKALFEEGFAFRYLPEPVRKLMRKELTVDDYFRLDESLVQAMFQEWTEERDPVLADLCARFLNRRLFKYCPIDPLDQKAIDAVLAWMQSLGWDPLYYAQIDFPLDLPYDVYRPGELEGKRPIFLMDDRKRLHEISTKSDIVRSISGIHRGQHQLFFPGELLAEPDMPSEVRALLGEARHDTTN